MEGDGETEGVVDDAADDELVGELEGLMLLVVDPVGLLVGEPA